MLNNYFYNHGHFCACHPLEVIILTLTVSLVSMSIFAIGDFICGWNEACPEEQGGDGIDVCILSVAQCLAVVYVYLQFRSLRRLGSKYLLGISGVFTVFSSFVFSIAVIKIFKKDLTGLSEALPLFLLLVDLSKACALARFALGSTNQDEVQKNIAEGMNQLGPSITLDAIVEMLVVGIGTLSGVRQLEMMSYFGCLSILANFIVFMSFYPACLALVLEVTRERNQGKPLRHLQHLARILEKEEKDKKPNPVTQRVKIIMSAGLVMVHAHSRLGTPGMSGSTLDGIALTGEITNQHIQPEMGVWHYYMHRLLTVKADITLTLVLAIFLVTKYVFFDDEVDMPSWKCPSCRNLASSQSQASTPVTEAVVDKSDQADTLTPVNNETVVEKKAVEFTLGESSDVEDEGQVKVERETQTNLKDFGYKPLERLPSIQPPKPLEECIAIMKSDEGPGILTDEEIIILVKSKHIPAYKLEVMLGDYERGVSIRRKMISAQLENQYAMEKLPYSNYEYELVNGACCENVVGYMPLPVGVAGPLLLDGHKYHVPLATTEGCLVASTNRGCRALEQSGGVQSSIIGDGMSRAPVVRFQSIKRASEMKFWLENEDNFDKVKERFDSTSRFARLKKIHTVQASRYLYIRFVARTGDAMGMNMLSKGAEKALSCLMEEFPDMEILSLSGNFCTDKKPSAVNWLEGRGKSVVCEAVIPSYIVQNVLKTSVSALVDLNISKNLMGSAMAGSIGGFNAHAANVVTAIFIATGQDPAQNICSSNCMTVMEATGHDNQDLYISCTMPSIEVGTLGGGTILSPQAACLQMLGVNGSSSNPGNNAGQLARVICGTVLAGELSLMSALAAGHLVRSHLKHNRSTVNVLPDNTNNSSKICDSKDNLLSVSPQQVPAQVSTNSKTSQNTSKICDSNNKLSCVKTEETLERKSMDIVTSQNSSDINICDSSDTVTPAHIGSLQLASKDRLHAASSLQLPVIVSRDSDADSYKYSCINDTS